MIFIGYTLDPDCMLMDMAQALPCQESDGSTDSLLCHLNAHAHDICNNLKRTTLCACSGLCWKEKE